MDHIMATLGSGWRRSPKIGILHTFDCIDVISSIPDTCSSTIHMQKKAVFIGPLNLSQRYKMPYVADHGQCAVLWASVRRGHLIGLHVRSSTVFNWFLTVFVDIAMLGIQLSPESVAAVKIEIVEEVLIMFCFLIERLWQVIFTSLVCMVGDIVRVD